MAVIDDVIAQTGGAAVKAIKDNVIIPQAVDNFNADVAYEALSNAETQAYAKQPFIRTKAKDTPGGSTAFGPVQITQTLADDALKSGFLSKDSENFYLNILKPRYEQMVKNGNNKDKMEGYNPAYDYGGNAEFNPKMYGQDYQMFAKDVISGVIKRAKGNEMDFLRRWRGQSMNQDPKYFERYNQGKQNFMSRMNAK